MVAVVAGVLVFNMVFKACRWGLRKQSRGVAVQKVETVAST